MGEGLTGPFEQRRGDGRGAVVQPAQRRQVEVGGVRILIAPVEQHLDHGRCEQDLIDALFGDGAQHRARLERRQYDMPASGQKQAGHGPNIGQVKHRHHMQKYRPDAIGARAHRRHRGAGDVVVAEHHALGKTRGATGVEDAQQVIAATTGVLQRCALGDQRLVGQHAGRCRTVAGIDQRAQGCRPCGDLRAQRFEGVIDDQHCGFRIVEGIENLVGAPAVVHRIQHGVCPGHRQVILDITRGVLRQHRHALAALHAMVLQGSRQPGHALGKLDEGQAPFTVTHRDRMRPLLHLAM
ncbi:hypothetical protein D3C80_1285960 [compost metagenome]